MEETSPSTSGTTRRRRKTKEEKKREADIFMLGQKERKEHEDALEQLLREGAKIMQVRARFPVGKSVRKIWHRVAVMPNGAISFVDHGFSPPGALLAEYELIDDKKRALVAHEDCCYSVLFELLGYKNKGFQTVGIHTAGRSRRGHGISRPGWHKDLWSNEIVKFMEDVYEKRMKRSQIQRAPHPENAVHLGIPFSHSVELRIRPIYRRIQEEAEAKLKRVVKELKGKSRFQHGVYNGGPGGTTFDYFASLVGKPRKR